MRFGSWLNEANPWWPHFRRFADYAARLTAVLSGSEYQAQLALLGPRADEWARDGRLYQPFPEVQLPWYHYHLWQALQQAGFGSDYVSEGVLRGARVEQGRLRYGTRSYDSLLLMDLESIEPDTAEALAGFAERGLRVVFVGRVPERAPGLKDADAADARVRAAVARVLAAKGALTSAPEPGGAIRGDATRGTLPEAAQRSLLQWAVAWTDRLGLEPDVRVEAPTVDVSFVHHRSGERDIYFVANTSRQDAAELVLRPQSGEKRPWLWDPETGTRAPLASARPDRLELHLEPLQSLLVVYEPPIREAAGDAATPATPLRCGRDELPVLAPWRVTLQPAAGEGFDRRFPQLFDLSLAAGDPALAGFGGVATYRAEFDWAIPRRRCSRSARYTAPRPSDSTTRTSASAGTGATSTTRGVRS